MSGGSYDYLFCKESDELFTSHNVRILEEMEQNFIKLGFIDVAKDFRRLIEYIKSANNRVEVLSSQLNEMMHDIEWYDSGDIGADTLAKRVEKYRQSDTPQTDCDKCIWNVCNYNKVEWEADTPQKDCPFKDVPCSCGEQDECEWHTELDTPQTESTGSPIGDYRDGVGAWQTDCDDRYAIRTDSGEVVAHACPLGCERTDCGWK